MEYVRQEHKHGCAIAALAMITGQSYSDVINNFDATVFDFNTGGLSFFPIDDYLSSQGYAVRRFTRCDQKRNKPRETWPLEPFAEIHICEVVNAVMCHMVVMLADGTVLDPANDECKRLSDYVAVNYIAGVYKVAVGQQKLAGVSKPTPHPQTKMEITVEVTESDIRKGSRMNCHMCPIALAVQRAIPEAYRVAVCPISIEVLGGGKRLKTGWQTVRPSIEVANFIAAFDNGKPVSPFTFKLNLS